MTAPDVLDVVDEKVGEAVVEALPVAGLEADAVGGARGDARGEGPRLHAVVERHLFLLRRLHCSSDWMRVVARVSLLFGFYQVLYNSMTFFLFDVYKVTHTFG